MAMAAYLHYLCCSKNVPPPQKRAVGTCVHSFPYSPLFSFLLFFPLRNAGLGNVEVVLVLFARGKRFCCLFTNFGFSWLQYASNFDVLSISQVFEQKYVLVLFLHPPTQANSSISMYAVFNIDKSGKLFVLLVIQGIVPNFAFC